MTRLTNAVGFAAIAVYSAAGVAAAATVDVVYKFNTAYGLNCNVIDEGDCDDFNEGDFEVGFSYGNVTVDESDSYAEGFDAFWLNYGGQTSASIASPIGLVSFQATGRGGPRIDFNEKGAFLSLSESFASTANPQLNFFALQGSYNFRQATTSVVDGNRSFFFSGQDLFDAPLYFRFENEDGAFVTGDFQMFDAELVIAVSADSLPVLSPVPVPATLPLLAIALGGLGLGAGRRRISRI